MAERDKTQIAELLFEPIGEDHVGRGFDGYPAAVGAEVMHRKRGHQPPSLDPTLNAADIGKPARLRKGTN
jgi:hypothetical protein